MIFPLWVFFQLARHAENEEFFWGLGIYLTLFGIVLLHELGHCFAGRAVGGSARQILLWPFGGLAYVSAAERPKEQFIVTAGGPAVNLAILLVLTPFMYWFDQPIGSMFLDLGGKNGNYLADLYAINLDLLLFNLIPAFPLDGGSMLLCALWHRLGQRRATEIAVVVGWIFAAVLFVVGLSTGQSILLFLAILGVFAGIQERQRVRMQTEEVYEAWRGDVHTGAGDSQEPSTGWWAQRREQRRARKVEQAARNERDRKARVDELLEKVSREGINALTPAEKRFLNDVSADYRRRKD